MRHQPIISSGVQATGPAFSRCRIRRKSIRACPRQAVHESCRWGAFTLLELLVVISIIAVVSTLAIPGVSSIQRGMALSNSAAQVLDYFATGRQMAMTLNQPIEIWLCQEASNDSLLLYRLKNGTPIAVERELKLHEGIAFSNDETCSSVLTDSISGVKQPTPKNNKIGRSFRFLPDGSTDLAGDDSPTLTLVYRTDATKPDLPANFITLQIDQQTGTVRIFQPQ